jgi:hypothetical protein
MAWRQMRDAGFSHVHAGRLTSKWSAGRNRPTKKRGVSTAKKGASNDRLIYARPTSHTLAAADGEAEVRYLNRRHIPTAAIADAATGIIEKHGAVAELEGFGYNLLTVCTKMRQRKEGLSPIAVISYNASRRWPRRGGRAAECGGLLRRNGHSPIS